MANKIVDITGQRFGKLVAIRYAGGGRWYCQCDCGNTATPLGTSLREGNTTSCGCNRPFKAKPDVAVPGNVRWDPYVGKFYELRYIDDIQAYLENSQKTDSTNA